MYEDVSTKNESDEFNAQLIRLETENKRLRELVDKFELDQGKAKSRFESLQSFVIDQSNAVNGKVEDLDMLDCLTEQLESTANELNAERKLRIHLEGELMHMQATCDNCKLACANMAGQLQAEQLKNTELDSLLDINLKEQALVKAFDAIDEKTMSLNDIGMEARRNGEHAKALECFYKIVGLEESGRNNRGKLAIIWNNMALLFRSLNRQCEEFYCFEQSELCDPEYYGIYYNRAVSYLRGGNCAEARNDVLKVLELDPGNKKAMKLSREIEQKLNEHNQ